jgi:phosphoribosylformimino-5-aminoimidazole carboxamide ribotide isomerase
MRFRPCIDLKDGQVVQIVGGSLSANDATTQTNFRSDRSSSSFAAQYREDGLTGGHVIALGSGNQEAALAALKAFPGGLQYGGGINPDNAAVFLDAGASHVIVTSYVFREGTIDRNRLDSLTQTVGRERLVLDLSCRKRDGAYWVVTDRWTRFTDLKVTADSLRLLAGYCNEFLVHGVDVEGKMSGIEEELVTLLGESSPIPSTYAGGARNLGDLDLVSDLGLGRVDLTIGSALDIFGGKVAYSDVLSWRPQK